MMKRTFVSFVQRRELRAQALETLVQGACGEWFQ